MPNRRPGRAPGKLRITPRGWVALGVVGLLVLGGLALGLSRLLRTPDCTVTTAGRTVELSTDRAEKVSAVIARAQRRGQDPVAAVAALLDDDDARAVVAALTGRAQAALTCRHGGADRQESDRLGSDGLTHRAELVRRDLLASFGRLPLGGFAPGGVHTGHMKGSAHYEGRAIDVFFRPANARNQRRGWALAQYFVANAVRLKIATVIYDARIWTARRADEGWRHYRVDVRGKSRETARILEHRDHVHVDVAD